MKTFALPITPAKGGLVEVSGAEEKIIQRIRRATGSNLTKATSMVDADEDLVLQVKNGDASAFETLVQKHQMMIHALTYRMTGSLADAEDLAQETFIRAYHQMEGFGGGAKCSTWLYSIAMHACLNWRRDEVRRYRAQANCAEDASIQRALGEAPSLESEREQQVQAALLKLPAKQRAAIVLTVYDGLNHAEAAKVLGCSETTVSWRLFAAKRKLKRLLEISGGRL